MADTKTTIEQAYFAFNERDIDGALALMTAGLELDKSVQETLLLRAFAVTTRSRNWKGQET